MLFRDILIKHKVSGYRLAKKTGIPQSTIASWVNGDRDPLKMSFENANKISETLKIEMNILFEQLTSN